VLFDGNSLTRDYGISDNSTYPAQTMALLGLAPSSYVNLGVPAFTTPGMSARALIDSRFAIDHQFLIDVAWEGRNDIVLNGASAATAYVNLVAYCQARRAAGLRVVIVTLLPSTSGVPGTYEADRQTVNGLLRANWPSFADALADPGGDATIGQPLSPNNLTYYVDGIHMTVAGYGIVASYVAPAIQRVLGLI
jgi:lysophospholipase L1-like esterase